MKEPGAKAVAAIGAILLLSMIAGAYALFSYHHTTAIVIALAQAPLYAAAAYFLWRMRRHLTGDSDRSMFLLVLGVGIALRAFLLFAPPHSTDVYRYVWDGRVQAAGINPYLFVPADPALAALRDEENIYPNINRKSYAPTIYPPTAQIVFYLTSRLSETVTAMKAAMLAFEALAVWALVGLLTARALPKALAGIYLWHPLPIWEVAGSGHVDIVAVAFLMVAFFAAEKRLRFASGIALAAATLVKYFPIALTPAIYRRWDWKMPAAFMATAILLYLPYISVGSKVFGFLWGYAGEELGSGEGVYLIALLKEAGLGIAALPIFLAGAAILLGLFALMAFFRPAREEPDLQRGFIIAVAFTALVSPHYCWYFLWLVPFLCFFPSLAVFWLTLSSTALYRLGWPPSLAGASVQYLPFAALIILESTRYFSSKEAQNEHALAR